MFTPQSPLPTRRPDEERSFQSWTERAARYHSLDRPAAPRAPAVPQQPTA